MQAKEIVGNIKDDEFQESSNKMITNNDDEDGENDDLNEDNKDGAQLPWYKRKGLFTLMFSFGLVFGAGIPALLGVLGAGAPLLATPAAMIPLGIIAAFGIVTAVVGIAQIVQDRHKNTNFFKKWGLFALVGAAAMFGIGFAIAGFAGASFLSNMGTPALIAILFVSAAVFAGVIGAAVITSDDTTEKQIPLLKRTQEIAQGKENTLDKEHKKGESLNDPKIQQMQNELQKLQLQQQQQQEDFKNKMNELKQQQQQHQAPHGMPQQQQQQQHQAPHGMPQQQQQQQQYPQGYPQYPQYPHGGMQGGYGGGQGGYGGGQGGYGGGQVGYGAGQGGGYYGNGGGMQGGHGGGTPDWFAQDIQQRYTRELDTERERVKAETKTYMWAKYGFNGGGYIQNLHDTAPMKIDKYHQEIKDIKDKKHKHKKKDDNLKNLIKKYKDNDSMTTLSLESDDNWNGKDGRLNTKQLNDIDNMSVMSKKESSIPNQPKLTQKKNQYPNQIKNK
jgi:hypothetical protein